MDLSNNKKEHLKEEFRNLQELIKDYFLEYTELNSINKQNCEQFYEKDAFFRSLVKLINEATRIYSFIKNKTDFNIEHIKSEYSFLAKNLVTDLEESFKNLEERDKLEYLFKLSRNKDDKEPIFNIIKSVDKIASFLSMDTCIRLNFIKNRLFQNSQNLEEFHKIIEHFPNSKNLIDSLNFVIRRHNHVVNCFEKQEEKNVISALSGMKNNSLNELKESIENLERIDSEQNNTYLKLKNIIEEYELNIGLTLEYLTSINNERNTGNSR